jgi:plastocyanin
MSIDFGHEFDEQPPAPAPYSRWKVTGGILAALILIFTGYFTLVRNNSHPASALTDGQILVSSKGFFPETMAVKHGQTVTWLNTESSPHWIFADPYPTGSSLPDLDSNDPLGLNDTYSFTFTNPGTYTYHDQLHPYKLHGTIVVK